MTLGCVAPQLTAPLWRIKAGLIGPALRAWAAFCLLGYARSRPAWIAIARQLSERPFG